MMEIVIAYITGMLLGASFTFVRKTRTDLSLYVEIRKVGNEPAFYAFDESDEFVGQGLTLNELFRNMHLNRPGQIIYVVNMEDYVV